MMIQEQQLTLDTSQRARGWCPDRRCALAADEKCNCSKCKGAGHSLLRIEKKANE